MLNPSQNGELVGIVRFQIMDNSVHFLSSVTKDLEVKTEKMILYPGGHATEGLMLKLKLNTLAT